MRFYFWLGAGAQGSAYFDDALIEVVPAPWRSPDGAGAGRHGALVSERLGLCGEYFFNGDGRASHPTKPAPVR